MERAHTGTIHTPSAKHLPAYLAEFVRRHNFRELDAIDQMQTVIAQMIVHRLIYGDLVG